MKYGAISRTGFISSVFIVMALGGYAAGDEIDWDTPHDSLLTQTVCPIDSSAAAMVVQKETLYRIENQGKYRIVIFEKKRIKIYSEAGLEYANFTIPYYHYQKVESIKATCYNYKSGKKELDKHDVHEEMWAMDRKKDVRLDAKTFAVPGAKVGSVIDVSYEFCQKYMVFLPPYVFHEDIPVQTAEVRVMIPDYYQYEYFITNPELADVNVIKRDKNPVMIATAENIPAIENEDYRPPKYNISTRMWLKLNKYEGPYYAVDLASSWESLLDFYEVPKQYAECLEKSDKVGKYVNESIGNLTDPDSIIALLFHRVRDDWADRLYGSVFVPLDNADKMLEMRTLDAESKATLLCSMLRHAGIGSQVLWICSRSDRLRDFPSFYIFDHALTYIPSKGIYLDPCDPGSEVNVIDEDYHDVLAMNITSLANEFLYTPNTSWYNDRMVDMVLSFGDSGSLVGEGHISFNYEKAIEARRKFGKLDDHGIKEWLNGILFSDLEDAVPSFSVDSDSGQTDELFTIDFAVQKDGFISANDDFPEIYIYPGVSFDKSSIDDKPPRQYPVYFGSKNGDYYKVVWELGEHFQPQSWEDIDYSEGLSVIGTFSAEYSDTSNSLTLVRQFNNRSAIYREDFSGKIEDIMANLKQHDKTSMILQRK